MKKDKTEDPDINKLERLLSEEPEIQKEGNMDRNFYAMLEEEKSKLSQRKGANKGILPVYFRIAAGIALFIMGWFGSQLVSNDPGGQQIINLSAEISELKETLVLAKLEQPLASDRIKAVNLAGEIGEIDSKLSSALLVLLNSDPSTNVRLVALETLIGYIDNPEVRIGIIESIGKQDSPLIQIRMAEIMESLGERRSLPEFERILDDVTLDYSVRSRINETINKLL